MVWGKTKLLIMDDLIAPRPRINVDFRGRAPKKFYREIPKLLASAFRVHGDAIQEKTFVMHKGEPEKFKASWEVIKHLDKFSYYRITVSLTGQSIKGHGEAAVVTEGTLRTEYPQDTVWQRSLFYEIMRMFWHSTFYTSKRSRYLIEGKKLITQFADDLKDLTEA